MSSYYFVRPKIITARHLGFYGFALCSRTKRDQNRFSPTTLHESILAIHHGGDSESASKNTLNNVAFIPSGPFHRHTIFYLGEQFSRNTLCDEKIFLYSFFSDSHILCGTPCSNCNRRITNYKLYISYMRAN